MKVRLRAFILDPMTVGSYKVVQNDRMSKLRRFLVLLVPNVSVTKVVRQAYSNLHPGREQAPLVLHVDPPKRS